MMALDELIDEIYRAFAVYEFRGPLLHDYCYISEEAYERLHTIPLRKLTAVDLQDYASSPCMDQSLSSTHNYKHFLPRMLELAANKPYFPRWGRGIGSIIENFTYGSLQWSKGYQAGWAHELLSPEEQLLLEQYLDLMWERTLVAQHDILEMLYALALIHDNLTPYFQQWMALCEQAVMPLLKLAAFISQTGFYDNKLLMRGFISGIKFTKYYVGMILEWLLEPSVTELVETQFFKYLNAPVQEELSYDLLEVFFMEPINRESFQDILLAKLSEAITDLEWLRQVYTQRLDLL